MAFVWVAFLVLLMIKLIRRHGWEYIPVLLIVAGVRLYTGDTVPGGIADALALVSVAGIWLVTGFTRVEA